MTTTFSEEDIRRVGEQLFDTEKSLPERFRALFTLRNLGGRSAIEQIARCFDNKTDGELLRHELAYCLGQLRSPHAVPFLKAVLANRDEYSMVRHEAAEALGAIGDESALNVLQEFAKDEAVEVRETVEIALDRIRFTETDANAVTEKSTASDSADDTANTKKTEKPAEAVSLFDSVDPALPFDTQESPSIDILDNWKLLLLDERARLFDRYRAMFTLRDIAARTRCQRTKQGAISALCASLNCRKSALFRHEVAFVLGQLAPELPVPVDDSEDAQQVSQEKNGETTPGESSTNGKQPQTSSESTNNHAESIVTDWVIEALVERICDTEEHHMVRHEAIEALGEIPAKECRRLIERFTTDPQRVVRESAIVALDMLDAHDSFQYCDTLAKLRLEEVGV